MGYKGIDYGMGQTNVDLANGIRYGVIGMNSEHLTEWAWEDMEPDYGDPTCPECGQQVYPPSEISNADPDADENADFRCINCHVDYDSDKVYEHEPSGHNLDDGGYKGFVGSGNDLMLIKSEFYTRAQFCSPCAPGACHLEHPMPDGEKCYCLGHDWFKGGRAPYPVYSVKDDTLMYPADGPCKGREVTDSSHLRTWTDPDGRFLLDVWDTYKTGDHGKSKLAYRFTDGGEVIFEGDDFYCPVFDSIDSDKTVGALLAFLALRPGDTDKEYFDGYTPRQLEWARENGETLGVLADDLEEGRKPDDE